MPRLPDRADYVIIGAGIHGLSTSMHLAQKLKAQGDDRRRGRRAHRRARQDRRRRRRLGHRLRRRAQQLLPAGDARTDGALRRGLGKRRRGLQLPPGRLHADQPRGDARAGRGRSTSSRRRSATSRCSSKAKPNRCAYMQGMLHDWQAKNITSVLHEKRGGYANNQASLRGLEQQGAGARRRDRRRRRR